MRDTEPCRDIWLYHFFLKVYSFNEYFQWTLGWFYTANTQTCVDPSDYINFLLRSLLWITFSFHIWMSLHRKCHAENIAGPFDYITSPLRYLVWMNNGGNGDQIPVDNLYWLLVMLNVQCIWHFNIVVIPVRYVLLASICEEGGRRGL